MNFSHLNLTGTHNLARDLICNLLSTEPPKSTCTFNYKKLNLDDILIHSKLHTEDEDSEEYARVHSENNRRRSRFLVTDTDLSLQLPNFTGNQLGIAPTDMETNLKQNIGKLMKCGQQARSVERPARLSIKTLNNYLDY